MAREGKFRRKNRVRPEDGELTIYALADGGVSVAPNWASTSSVSAGALLANSPRAQAKLASAWLGDQAREVVGNDGGGLGGRGAGAAATQALWGHLRKGNGSGLGTLEAPAGPSPIATCASYNPRT